MRDKIFLAAAGLLVLIISPYVYFAGVVYFHIQDHAKD